MDGASGQAQMGKDLGDHRRIVDGGDDRHGAAIVRIVFQIDLKTRLSNCAQLRRARVEATDLKAIAMVRRS